MDVLLSLVWFLLIRLIRVCCFGSSSSLIDFDSYFSISKPVQESYNSALKLGRSNDAEKAKPLSWKAYAYIM